MGVVCGIVAIAMLRQAPSCRGRWCAPPFLKIRGNPGLVAFRGPPGGNLGALMNLWPSSVDEVRGWRKDADRGLLVGSSAADKTDR